MSTFLHGHPPLQVDRIWRNIMAKTVSDTRVLQATSQPNMLVGRGGGCYSFITPKAIRPFTE